VSHVVVGAVYHPTTSRGRISNDDCLDTVTRDTVVMAPMHKTAQCGEDMTLVVRSLDMLVWS